MIPVFKKVRLTFRVLGITCCVYESIHSRNIFSF